MKRSVAYALAMVELFMLCRGAGPALTELEAMGADVAAALLVGFYCVTMVGTVAVALLSLVDATPDWVRFD